MRSKHLLILFFSLVVILHQVSGLQKILKKRKKVEGQEIGPLNRDRNGRFLSLFTIVRFNNDPCATSSGHNGTCYTASECSNRGGTNDGTCAAGFGVCCHFEFECGRTTSENATYFVNPPQPQRICNLMINRYNNDICQIRVEFETFELSPPDFRGQCITDFFLVTGGSPVPTLCGRNSGQHVLYTVTPDSGPSQLSMVLDTSTQNSSIISTRRWKLKVFQYECSSPNRAPSGCLQYYTSASGSFSSFNYQTTVIGDGPNHLANLNYAICFRMENGFCGIKYSQVTSDIYSFTVSGTKSEITNLETNGLQKTLVKYSDTNCNKDYVVIPGGSETGLNQDKPYSYDRFCGLTLGYCQMPVGGGDCTMAMGPIQTYTRPFVFGVVTNANDGDPITDSTDNRNRGFNLLYSQLPCATLG